ncbi:hypothetical protein GCM10012285_52320 [Streptomyces kronopolitis]|uniref:Uncharacterized protein n=1 Tax=Streptomyces kronopolitis TaxID=1612435 RepID=A0ABQ2JYV2_9ACTN|nr:hypothetical protein GCM10012285_52320 [Streptomyces kronopolitis]
MPGVRRAHGPGARPAPRPSDLDGVRRAALGRHFCVGALPAAAEVETGVNQLLDAFPAMAFADGPAPADGQSSPAGGRRRT